MYELQLTRKKKKKETIPSGVKFEHAKRIIDFNFNLSMESLPKTISPLNILLVTVACGVRTFFFPLIY